MTLFPGHFDTKKRTLCPDIIVYERTQDDTIQAIIESIGEDEDGDDSSEDEDEANPKKAAVSEKKRPAEFASKTHALEKKEEAKMVDRLDQGAISAELGPLDYKGRFKAKHCSARDLEETI